MWSRNIDVRYWILKLFRMSGVFGFSLYYMHIGSCKIYINLLGAVVVVGFITTYSISVYHHWSYEFEPRSDELYPIQHYSVIDLRQVVCFLRVFLFPPPIKLTATIYLNIVENGIKHHNPNPVELLLAISISVARYKRRWWSNSTFLQ